MFIMVEVTVEMAEELKASAAKQNKSVAAEVGDRLERLAKLESQVAHGQASIIWHDYRQKLQERFGGR